MKLRKLLYICVLVFVFAVFYKINSLMVSVISPGFWLRMQEHISWEYVRIYPLLRDSSPITKVSPVMFVETTETLTPQPLVICSVESAARIYQDRPVHFLLKGFRNRSCLQSTTECPGLKLLTDFPNVQLLHLDPKVVLKDTPLAAWYNEDKIYKENYWIWILSDAYRLALVWKYGGIYFDTDIINIKKVSEENFVVCEEVNYLYNAAIGFHQHHPYIMDCMADFVLNYNGAIWGHQGPHLFTRVMTKSCPIPNYSKVLDFSCDIRNVTIMHQFRFYPIHWTQWGKYFEVWKETPTFGDSYGLHLWNYMNREAKKRVVLESNTLVENLFIKYCPSTYDILVKKANG
ncbi:alpha-1,4-N-acetylglucosaminyltransferase-like [Protopterus annectens]|uniref:alpha-1,4-N-acetylglucosaminyltransferase-like n=1 Tax=Protopterus annectens TaxID=7888 RepID=UPI001CFBC154|nr:alpha-1,4-N-acetylglucosaminyltransferase-like [Protopterus annectens]